MARVCPGQRLGDLAEFEAGSGTYARGLDDGVYASVLGTQYAMELPSGKSRLVVRAVGAKPLVIPEVGSLVTAKVTVVNPRFARVDILCVNAAPTSDVFRGMIRVQDVRATEPDKVQIYSSFRPGDIVLCRVISLGDARSYLLSTAQNELGVVFATSVAGAPLVPVSWCEMKCEKTGATEARKVAKVVPAATS